jgi:hypothetical protein
LLTLKFAMGVELVAENADVAGGILASR